MPKNRKNPARTWGVNSLLSTRQMLGCPFSISQRTFSMMLMRYSSNYHTLAYIHQPAHGSEMFTLHMNSLNLLTSHCCNISEPGASSWHACNAALTVNIFHCLWNLPAVFLGKCWTHLKGEKGRKNDPRKLEDPSHNLEVALHEG